MEKGNRYAMKALHGAHPALHCLQGIASNMPDVYEKVHFPFYGGSSRMGTLFLTRKMTDAQKISLSIQQTSDTGLEAFVIGKPDGKIPATAELLVPLLEKYRAHYPMACDLLSNG